MMPSSDRMSLPVSDPPPQQKGSADEQRLFKGSTMTSGGAYDAVSYMSCAGIKSKDELLYQQWMDKEGKTPLILASMSPQLYDVAKTLIKLGANVNAYRPGRHAGTPLHHAAKRGLEQMVKLLLSHGANALVMNDDCQTALDVARLKGYSNVERAIEFNDLKFSANALVMNDDCQTALDVARLKGYSNVERAIEFNDLTYIWFLNLNAIILESHLLILPLAARALRARISLNYLLLNYFQEKCKWVVILPCGARKLTKPFKLELAIYSGLQDAKPQSLLPLWKVNMDEPNFNQPDPIVIISSSNSNFPTLFG
ncbi:hypothetical protein LXL04_000442 [Taraxacum kok-saghyz]